MAIFTISPSASAHAGHDPQTRLLKRKILRIAERNRENPDRLRIRNRLDPLVNTLVERTPNLTQEERARLVQGSWRSLWSDQEFGRGVDYSQVYQVVTGDNYYYNISKVHSPDGVVTNYLRGAFEAKDSYLAIEFTANAIVPGFPEDQTDLYQLATSYEAGEIRGIDIPGPLGVTGALLNIYVDRDLRIVYGNSSSDTRPRLFILRRQSTVGP